MNTTPCARTASALDNYYERTSDHSILSKAPFDVA